MISDVLFEALDQIEEYQRDCDFMYDDLRDLIDPVTDAMRSLLTYLDTPPNPGALEAPRARAVDAAQRAREVLDARAAYDARAVDAARAAQDDQEAREARRRFERYVLGE